MQKLGYIDRARPRNPSMKEAALHRVDFETSVTFTEEEIPNIKSFRINVYNWAKRNGVKLSVHHDRWRKEIEVTRAINRPLVIAGIETKPVKRYEV